MKMSREYGKAQNHHIGLNGRTKTGLINKKKQCLGNVWPFVKGHVKCFIKSFRFHVLHWIHPDSNIHSWAVGKECCQSSFLKQTKDEDFVPMKKKKKKNQIMVNIIWPNWAFRGAMSNHKLELNKQFSLIDIRPIFYGLFDARPIVYILHSLL